MASKSKETILLIFNYILNSKNYLDFMPVFVCINLYLELIVLTPLLTHNKPQEYFE